LLHELLHYKLLESLITAVTGRWRANRLPLKHGEMDGPTRNSGGSNFCRPLARAHCCFFGTGAALQGPINGSPQK
jgi:hypothetical protein